MKSAAKPLRRHSLLVLSRYRSIWPSVVATGMGTYSAVNRRSVRVQLCNIFDGFTQQSAGVVDIGGGHIACNNRWWSCGCGVCRDRGVFCTVRCSKCRIIQLGFTGKPNRLVAESFIELKDFRAVDATMPVSNLGSISRGGRHTFADTREER
jgi:hypothetical protein